MVNFRIKSHEYGPIGLDIGHNSIKMIQFCISDGKIGIAAADKVRIDVGEPGQGGNSPDSNDADSKEIILTIKKMLANGSFRGAEAVFSLPIEKLKITSLRLRQMEIDQTDDLITSEAASRFNLNPQIDTIRYKLAGVVRQGDETMNEYILFGADDESIRNQIQIIEQAGLRPVGLDPFPCAIYRCFARFMRRQEDKEQAEILVDVGSKGSTVVFGRGGDIGFVKSIPFGTVNMNQEIASRLGVNEDEAEMLRCRLLRKSRDRAVSNSDAGANESGDDLLYEDNIDASTHQSIVDAVSLIAERIAKEISLCFRYYTVTFRGKRAQKATIAGGGAYENILLNVLKRYLAVDVVLAQPLSGMDMTGVKFDFDRRSVHPEWAVATGLGLKGCELNTTVKQAVRA